MSSLHRRLDVPKFSQTVALIRDVLRRHTPDADRTEFMELVKARHLEMGFSYTNDQIHRALSAVLDGPTAPLRYTNPRSDRST